MKKIFAFLTFFMIAYATVKGYFFITDGFSIRNISSENIYHQEWETPDLSASEKIALDAILSQKFHYLTKGAQSYIFVSEDEKYVLKFFKQKHLRIPFWAKSTLLSHVIKPIQDKKIERKTNKLNQLYLSCKLAFTELKEESGLLFVHLNKDHFLDQKTIIKDKMGFEHLIDLNQIEFVVQKKAEPADSVMQKWLNNKEIEKAKEGITSLINILEKRYSKGIVDLDTPFLRNLGFMGNEAVIIDVGGFQKKDSLQLQDYSNDVGKKKADFFDWLEKSHAIIAKNFQDSTVGCNLNFAD